MWIRNPPYTVLPSLPEILRHDTLPAGAVELGRIVNSYDKDLWLFVKNAEHLSLLSVASRYLADGRPYYRCAQADFPLEFLVWFPPALEDFQRPPAEGGLHAGGMTTPDQNVDGEMLCIQRALGAGGGLGGYAALNRSRCRKGYDPKTEFDPHEVSWPSSFLYDDGLLDLIKQLGEKYKAGTL